MLVKLGFGLAMPRAYIDGVPRTKQSTINILDL